MNDRELHDAFVMIEANAQAARLYLIRGVRREADASLDNIAWISSEVAAVLKDRANLTDRADQMITRIKSSGIAAHQPPGDPIGSSTPADNRAEGSSPAEPSPDLEAGVDDTTTEWEMAFRCDLCGEPFDARGALLKHRRKGCPADPVRARAADGIGHILDNSPETLEHTLTKSELLRARGYETVAQ